MMGAEAEDTRARELREACQEVTRLRDLLTDVWTFCRVHDRPMTAREERVWAQVEALVHEGTYGWGGPEVDVHDLLRRVRRIEEILHRAAVTTTREV